MSLFPSFQKRSLLDPRFWGDLVPTTKSGISVSEKNALKYLTVFSCVSLIAGDVARLPLILYRRYPDGSKKRMVGHPLYDMLHNAPNSDMTSYNWRESAQGHLLLWGNHYSLKNGETLTGRLESITPLDNPGAVEVKRERGKIVYMWTDASGEKHRATRDQIFHIPGFGFDGLVGHSMISIARESIGLGMAAEEFSSRFYGQGTHIAGTLEMDTWVGPDKRKEVEQYIRDGFAGLGKSHSVFLAEGGMKYKPMTMPLRDAQHIEGRDYQKLEICGMYHVPPHKIARHGSNSNYNNLEQENASYVDSCLMHWIVRWEQCIGQQLLTEKERRQGFFVEFLVDGLLRGDSQARGEFYTKLFQVGGLSPNDIRAKENMDPVEGGDQRFVQLNMIPLDMAAEVVKQQQAAEASEPQTDQDDGQRSIRREKRSITARDRIAEQYRPLIKRAAQRIVNLEGNAVKRQVEKQRKLRAESSIIEWLDEFYRGLDTKIRDEFGPVFRSFAQAVVDEATDELGVGFSKDDLADFVSGFLDVYTARHIGSSLGQLRALAREDIEELEKRVDEWTERRSDKIAMNEAVRLANAAYQTVSFTHGLTTVWRIRGKDTCQYCKALNGKSVKRGGQILGSGDVLYAGPDDKTHIYNPDDPESKRPKGSGDESGWSAMKIRGKVMHPPLHQGCDCYVSAV